MDSFEPRQTRLPISVTDSENTYTNQIVILHMLAIIIIPIMISGNDTQLP